MCNNVWDLSVIIQSCVVIRQQSGGARSMEDFIFIAAGRRYRLVFPQGVCVCERDGKMSVCVCDWIERVVQIASFMRKSSPPFQRDSSLLGSTVFIFQHVVYLAVIWDINKTATPDPGCAANVQIDTFEFLFWRAENNNWVCVQVGLPSERCSYTSQSNCLQLYASLPDSFNDLFLFSSLFMVTHGHPRLQDNRSAAHQGISSSSETSWSIMYNTAAVLRASLQTGY